MSTLLSICFWNCSGGIPHAKLGYRRPSTSRAPQSLEKAQDCSRKQKSPVLVRGRAFSLEERRSHDDPALGPIRSLALGQLAHRRDQVFELERLVERLHRADLARDLEHVEVH